MSSTSPLSPVNLTAPGRAGVTAETSIAGDVPEWLFRAENAVFNKEGLIAPRQLFREMPPPSGDGIVPIIDLADYVVASYTADAYFILNVTKNKLYVSYGGGFTDITALGNGGNPAAPTYTSVGPLTVVYLQKKYYIFDFTHKPAIYDPYATPSALFYTANSYVTSPFNYYIDVAHAAFGRIWGAFPNSTKLYWSVLLNGDDWSGTGSGNLDLSMYCTQGEYITAISDFNNYLIVFTNKSTLIFENPFTVPVDDSGVSGTTSTMSLKDQLDGVGCVNRRAWCNVGEELFFLDTSGLKRMSRVIQEGGSNPLDSVVPQINGFLIQTNAQPELTYLKSLRALVINVIGYRVFVVWLGRPIENNSYAVTTWGSFGAEDKYEYAVPWSLFSCIQEYVQFPTGAPSIIALCKFGPAAFNIIYNGPAMMPLAGSLSGTVDTASLPLAEQSYNFRVSSAWLNLGGQVDSNTKIMKDLKMIYRTPMSPYAPGSSYVSQPLQVTYNLRFDYSEDPMTHTFTTPLIQRGDNINARYLSPHTVTPLPLSGNGSLVQWEIRATINNKAHEAFAVQRAGLQSKLGRINQGL